MTVAPQLLTEQQCSFCEEKKAEELPTCAGCKVVGYCSKVSTTINASQIVLQADFSLRSTSRLIGRLTRRSARRSREHAIVWPMKKPNCGTIRVTSCCRPTHSASLVTSGDGRIQDHICGLCSLKWLTDMTC